MFLKRYINWKYFGLTNNFKKLKGITKELIEPKGYESPIMDNANLVFDDESAEWQALIIGNSYDLNTFNSYSAVTQNNFGTVDNPHVIFTSDAPYRYVGCSGQPNEDEYDGHEFLLFMLREGPLQRCMSCGQVFKLVRLRNEFNEENDYYESGMIPYEIQDMLDSDHAVQQSVLRLLPNTYEHSLHETPFFNSYTLVNPDDHDRILVDPAYRMQKMKNMDEKLRVMFSSLKNLDISYKMDNPPDKLVIDKHDYEVLLKTEKLILKYDRHFKRIQKFNLRQLVDPENHERREKRMLEKSNNRINLSSTIYFNELSELEQKYKDYFETDLEQNPDNEQFLQRLDEINLLSKQRFKLSNYSFRETFARLPTENYSSVLDKLLFNFKYRRSNMNLEDFLKAEDRMLSRSKKRMDNPNYNKTNLYFNKINNPDLITEEKALIEKEYLDFIIEESINQFKDFYEGDNNIDLEIINNLTNSEKKNFLDTFVDIKTYENIDDKKFISMPIRKYNPKIGLFKNIIDDALEFRKYILPFGTYINNLNLSNVKIPEIDYNEYKKNLKFPKLEENQKKIDKKLK